MSKHILLAFLFTLPLLADPTEDAQRRLAEKAAQRAAAATQPTTLTQGEVDQLRAELVAVKAQLAKSQAESAAFKAQLASMKSDAEKRDAEAKLLASRPPEIQAAIAAHRIAVGMTPSEVTVAMVRSNMTYSDIEKEEELRSGKVYKYETWYLNRREGGKVHFTNGIVDRISERSDF